MIRTGGSAFRDRRRSLQRSNCPERRIHCRGRCWRYVTRCRPTETESRNDRRRSSCASIENRRGKEQILRRQEERRARYSQLGTRGSNTSKSAGADRRDRDSLLLLTTTDPLGRGQCGWQYRNFRPRASVRSEAAHQRRA